jgi:hypothetical protein
MRFVGANPRAQIVPGHRENGTVNYLTASQHRTSLPTYGEVTYRELWPGIDMVFRGQGGKLKYEFHVAPGADPDRIRLAYTGADGLSLGSAGDLLIATRLGTLRDARPVSYQRTGGERVPVKSSYAIAGSSAYGFSVAGRNGRRPLVIDPALEYSTFFGGNGNDEAFAVAVDATGSAYLTGRTNTGAFPTTPGAFDTVLNSAAHDVFVMKLNPTGSAPTYSTYIGGAGHDAGNGIAIDAAGAAYVTGYSDSADFPVTGAPDPTANGARQIIVTKVNPSGSSLDYSILFGGTQKDEGAGIAVDADGNAYVVGYTESLDYPTTSGAYDTSYEGGDAVVTKVSSTGTAFGYSTFLGGSSWDSGRAIALDGDGNAYVTGHVSSVNFPTTPGAFDTTRLGGMWPDSFITKLNPAGSALAYSTYLEATDSVTAWGIAVDPDGSAYVTGGTDASDFPTTPGAFDVTGGDASGGYTESDGFVTKLSPAGTDLVYSTYLGGAQSDGFSDIAVDSAGRAVVAGGTESDDYPTTAGAFDTRLHTNPTNPADAVVTRLNANGTGITYSTYLGASLDDSGFGIAVDAAGKAYVVGRTISQDFPRTAGAFNPGAAPDHFGNVFVTKLSLQPEGYPRPKAASSLSLPLVPAYSPCTSPNRTHGPPLAFGSCSPPANVSGEVTLGTPDANGKPVKGEGSVTFTTLNGIPATPADEADVRLTFELSDVYHSTLIDYSGELRAHVGLRVTDKLNDPGDNGTMTDTTLGATVPCASTPDTMQGGSCALVTTVDALVPGTVSEGKRSVWELGQIQVDDGGDDWDAETPAGNTLFMVQGLFVP